MSHGHGVTADQAARCLVIYLSIQKGAQQDNKIVLHSPNVINVLQYNTVLLQFY